MSPKSTVKTIAVNLKANHYSIHIANNLFKKLPFHINKLKLGDFGIIITSSKVYSLYQKTIRKNFPVKNYKIIKVVDGESAKSRKWLFKVIDEIIRANDWRKRPFIVCLGGGTVGDLGGFIAAIYRRGIPYIQVPTTLLAQIDSSIGGKTAIDTPQAKNILGAFYQPKAVFIDPNLLSTLPTVNFKEGLAEVIKYGVIKDLKLFQFLKSNHKKILKRDRASILKIVTACVKIKAKIVEADEKETKGLRTTLNFGHTFAHALESSSRYKKISHGKAVALGMIYAANLSLLLGKCKPKALFELSTILKLFALPTSVTFNSVRTYETLLHDKKFISGKIRMVLLRAIGRVEVCEGIAPSKIKKAFKVFDSGLH